MSVEMKDIRSSVPELTDAVLDAVAGAREITKQEVIREILNAWTSQQLAVHRSIRKDLTRLGLNEYGERSK